MYCLDYCTVVSGGKMEREWWGWPMCGDRASVVEAGRTVGARWVRWLGPFGSGVDWLSNITKG